MYLYYYVTVNDSRVDASRTTKQWTNQVLGCTSEERRLMFLFLDFISFFCFILKPVPVKASWSNPSTMLPCLFQLTSTMWSSCWGSGRARCQGSSSLQVRAAVWNDVRVSRSQREVQLGARSWWWMVFLYNSVPVLLHSSVWGLHRLHLHQNRWGAFICTCYHGSRGSHMKPDV